jgi:hypothetical protein
MGQGKAMSDFGAIVSLFLSFQVTKNKYLQSLGTKIEDKYRHIYQELLFQSLKKKEKTRQIKFMIKIIGLSVKFYKPGQTS